MATTTASSFLNLNWADFIKGAILAALTTPFTLILDSLNAGSLTFDWKHLGIVAISGLAGYLLKNLLSPATITLSDVSKAEVKSVKDGNSVATVVLKSTQNNP